MEKKEEYYSLGEFTATLNAFVRFVLRKWWLLVLVCVAGLALAIIYHRIQKPKYVAVSSFILEDKSSGSGGLAGIASQFGLNIGGMSGGGSLFAGDNILNILQSKKIVEEVLLSKVDENDKSGKTLADLYMEFSGFGPRGAAAATVVPGKFFVNAQMPLSPLQDSLLNAIYEEVANRHLVSERASKQGSIIRVRVTSANSIFSRLMAERIVDESSKLYLEIKTGTAQDNISKMQRRADSLLALLNNKSFSAAAAQALDANPGLRAAIVPGEIANRDKTVLSTLYAEVTKNLEASKLILTQQTPVIQLLDRPSYLLDDNRKSMLFLAVIAVFLAGVFYVGIAFLLFLVKRKPPVTHSQKIEKTDNEA